MASYQCCDCGEIKATKCDLEAHLNADHIGWTPYQCFYCSQQGVSTRKPSKEMLRKHVTQRHPNEVFTFLCTDNQTNEERLKDMLNRSSSACESPVGICSTTPLSVNASGPGGNVTPPFIICLSESPHPQPKKEVIDVEEYQNASVKTLTEEGPNKSDDIKPNLGILGNCRCGTCQKSVPRNLTLIRDHVKLHFKEKTGCVPTDLINLLPSLQQVYCQLLMSSFPAVGASILDDDIPSCNQRVKEPKNSDPNQTNIEKELLDQLSFSNDTHPVDNDSVLSDSDTTSDYKCKKCGERFRRLASLKTHLIDCKLDKARDDVPESVTMDIAQTPTTHHHSTIERTSTVLASCGVCDEKFCSTFSMHLHRAKKHGIVIKRYCKPCKLEFDGSGHGGGVPTHLLRIHLHKNDYGCSLCGTKVFPSGIDHHDRTHHGGLGRAVVINNLHRYKSQVETMRRKLIIDISLSLGYERKLASDRKPKKKLGLHHIHSSLTSQKRLVLQSHSKSNAKLSRLIEVKGKKTNSYLSCEICDARFSSINGALKHRSKKHGIFVKWFCKQCNINVKPGTVNVHLLTVHIKKKMYECSLCEHKVVPNTFSDHDRLFHDGQGKAVVVNNLKCYKLQLEALHKTLIVDLNSSLNTKNQLAPGREPRKNLELHHNTAITSSTGHKQNHHSDNGISVKSSKTKEYVRVDTTKSVWSCEICNKLFSSAHGKRSHRSTKHGIFVKWFCKQCNINIDTHNVNNHLLRIHLGKKKLYECSLCKITVLPSTFHHHDIQFHGGLGKATIINNLQLYKSQLEALRKTSMIDANSSFGQNGHDLVQLTLPSLTSKERLSHEVLSKGSPNTAKSVDVKTKRPNEHLTCEVCHLAFPSLSGLKFHRSRKHGILVKWHCIECNINLDCRHVNDHLLIVHLHENRYVCSLCEKRVAPHSFDHHDKQFHGGLGKALIVNNQHRYQSQLDELRKKVIIDLNSSPSTMSAQPSTKLGHRQVKPKRNYSFNNANAMSMEVSKSAPKCVEVETNSTENEKNPISQSNKSKRLIANLRSNLGGKAASDTNKWLLSFKRSQKRKQRKPELLTFKQYLLRQ